MRRIWILLLAVSSVIFTAASTAQEPAKFALLIGNQSYDASVGVLKNPHNDIALVGEALARQGFQILPPLKDARRSAILGGVRTLVRRLNAAPTGAIGFIYYSGHGAAEKDTNTNYLIPVDAREPGTLTFWDESLKLDDILRLLDGARAAAKFIVFDACRSELQLPEKDTTKGLVPVAEQQGMFIAYASAPGRTASDRGERSGPYAAALASELAKPELDHLNLFQNVKETVLASTGGVQQPWESNGLARRYYLTTQPKADTGSPNAGATPQAAPAISFDPALQAWDRAKDTTSQAVLEDFIRRYGDSFYASLARDRLEALKRRQGAVVAPPTPPPAPPTVQPAVGVSPPALPTSIAIATGGTGGVYYPLGGGMANVLSKYVPGVAATARVTGGSVDNLKLISSHQSEVALVMVDAALDALKGEDKFKGTPVEVRTLMVLYPNRMHVVTTASTGIKTLADLKGKRVSTGSPGSATEVMAFRVIEAAGLDKDKDMKRERLGVGESVNALKDGKIDAFFWVGGLPTAAVTDLGATSGVKIKLIDHADVLDKMNAKHGGIYTAGVIPAKTYPGQDADNKITVVQNILVANAKFPDKVAYDIVKTFIEKRDELIAVHGEAKSITLENQSTKNSPIPWHPGAVKYFTEKGVKM